MSHVFKTSVVHVPDVLTSISLSDSESVQQILEFMQKNIIYIHVIFFYEQFDEDTWPRG